MQQSSSGVLVSLIMIVALAAAFALGIRYLGSGLTAAALPAPTATVRAATVVGPSGPGPRSGSSGQSGGSRGTPTPLAIPTPRPRPTVAPPPQVKVTMATSLGAGETAATPASEFPASLPQVYCVATFRKITPTDQVIVRFMSRDQNIKIWAATQTDFKPPISVPSTDASRAIYLSGPFNPGKYSCDVLLNGKMAGSAPYTMR